MFVGVLLVFVSLVMYRRYSFTGSWSIDLRDVVHWYGIIGATLFASATALSVNRFRRPLGAGWVNAHCPLGLLALVFAALHSRTKAAVILPVHYSSFFTLLVMSVVVVSGLLFRYLPGRSWHGWLRLLHGPLVASLYLALLYHVLVKLAVI